jgi:uncharacterized membrane protein (DUF106 family)
MVEKEQKKLEAEEETSLEVKNEEQKVKPAKKKASFHKTKKGQIILSIVAFAVITYIAFFSNVPKEPRVLGFEPLHFIYIAAAILSLVVTLVYRFGTDQPVMRELKKELKKHQGHMREHRKDPVKISEISKKSMEVNMQYMKHTMKPMFITMIPFLLIFTWLRGQFSELVFFNLPFWPHTLGWVGTYIIFSMIFTTVFRKALNVV